MTIDNSKNIPNRNKHRVLWLDCLKLFAAFLMVWGMSCLLMVWHIIRLKTL